MNRIRGMFAGLILVAAVSLTGCSTRVSPGMVGIQVNYSGTGRGVSDYPVVTGRVWYNPYSTQILEYPVFVQTVVLTASTHEGNNPNSPAGVDESITFTNKDKMTINADVSLSYHLVADKVPAFYIKFRSDDLNQFTYGFMRNVLRDAFNEHGGRYTIDQIMGDNAQFITDVRTSLQAELTPIGVQLDQFGFIGSPRPPQAVTEQINASVHATQLTQQKQNELFQVQADAAKAVAEAEGVAAAKLKWADAEAAANNKISNSITPSLLEKMRLEKWDGKLPQMIGGSNNPFINLSPGK